MPYTLKTNQISVKDPVTGEYQGVDILAEQTEQGLIAELQAEGTTQVNRITQAAADVQAAVDQAESDAAEIISDTQTAVDTLEAQKNTIAQTVASMAELGTDTTLTTTGMAADAKTTGDQLSYLNRQVSELDTERNWKSIKLFIDNIELADDDRYTPDDSRSYISVLTNWLIVPAGNTWNAWVGYTNALIRIPENTRKVKIQGHGVNITKYCMLTTNVMSIARPSYATGYSAPVTIPQNKEVSIDIPDDAKFIYLSLIEPTDVDVKPENVSFLCNSSGMEGLTQLIDKSISVSDYDNTIFSYLRTDRKITYVSISRNNTTWNTIIPGEKTLLVPLVGAVKVSITANASYNTEYVLLKSFDDSIKRPDYAKWYAHPLILAAGDSITLDVEDAKLLYLGVLRDSDGNLQDWSPSEITLYFPEYARYANRKPLFCFVDDDAMAVALTWLEQVIDATRIPISIALITGAVGSANFSTWDNLRRLQNKGFVFVNHTNTTVPLTTMSQADIIDSFEASQALMQQHGMPDSNILVLPGGATNASINTIIKNYFTAVLSTKPRINLPPIDTFSINRVDLDTYINSEPAYVDSLSYWKTWVDKTIAVNGLCIFYGHAYHEDYGEEKLADYIALIRYIAQKGCEIVSLPEAIKRFGNIIEGDVTVGRDGI